MTDEGAKALFVVPPACRLHPSIYAFSVHSAKVQSLQTVMQQSRKLGYKKAHIDQHRATPTEVPPYAARHIERRLSMLASMCASQMRRQGNHVGNRLFVVRGVLMACAQAASLCERYGSRRPLEAKQMGALKAGAILFEMLGLAHSRRPSLNGVTSWHATLMSPDPQMLLFCQPY